MLSEKESDPSKVENIDNADDENNNSNNNIYQFLVVDSGPIIRFATGTSSLWNRARDFYTVPAVIREIRDAKARQHLDQLPFELKTREPSHLGLRVVVDFARQTGDFQSLSSVDLQVLALLYDLEREACGGDMNHIRTSPKRILGLGKIETLKKRNNVVDGNDCFVVDEEESESQYPTKEKDESKEKEGNQNECVLEESKPTTWAQLLNPNASSEKTSLSCVNAINSDGNSFAIAGTSKNVSFSQNVSEFNKSDGGQFSDAESDRDFESDNDGIFSDESDEECDAYVLDPEELDDKKLRELAVSEEKTYLDRELQSEFPSLAAAAIVFHDENDDDETMRTEIRDLTILRAQEEEQKLQSLMPISKSGKLYNSFTRYGNLMKPKPVNKMKNEALLDQAEAGTVSSKVECLKEDETKAKIQSRIVGGMGFSGQGDDVEDDGEGWITCTEDFQAIKAAGALDPSRNLSTLHNRGKPNQTQGPPNSCRAACTTTDFAMQNVILQMNLELLSVDGLKVRKLKNWVTRCGACFTVYTSSDNSGPLGKRLFCERCGSDLMQRIAASVDGKTGRLRLHLSKKYKHNLRGTKFSLPKPGGGNRFQGDLLLREDQLMMGAWNQKVKIRSGGKAKDAAQSMFGRDIATNVGCHASALTNDDIRVGFGRRNPNAAKGRERRGKKKKTSDKACGLRRY